MIKRRVIVEKNKTRRRRHTAGFTMAEMLIVVAIIGVLAAVSFIAVQAHQKSMTQLQYDAIAKEIFVAAQNHLTLAKSENYQDTATLTHSRGAAGQAAADQTGTTGGTAVYNNDIFYFTSSDFTADGSSILDQMLPFGSVELVTGGSFIIRYQPKAARVLDVFYWTDGSDRYDANLSGTNYATLVGSADSASDRHKNYDGKAVVGWFGGEKDIDSGDYLQAPEIEVINAEMLLVKVTDKNTDATLKQKTVPLLKLIVSGTQSGAKVAIPLGYPPVDDNRITYDSVDNVYTVVLDDITGEDRHFAGLNGNTKFTYLKNNGTNVDFILGENITIQAVSYSNTVLTSVAYSGEWTTNSLFGEVTEVTTGTGATATKRAEQVKISNIRHLENLNDDISVLAYDESYFGNAISAVQTVDLDWSAFKTGINTLKKVTGNPSINIFDESGGATKADCFLPVSANYTLTYNGQSEVVIPVTTGEGESAVKTEETIIENHSIKGVVVDNTGTGEAAGTSTFTSGGVFGTLTGATIKNLALIDTSVTLAYGDAGALVGKLTQNTALASSAFNVSNVVAYHTDGKADTAKITTGSGNVGGLIGQMVGGNCKIEKSAAALIVSTTGGNAGGLIGTADGGTVSACYSGGHASEKKNGTEVIGVNYDPDNYNVTASAYAGGLIGDAGAAAISNSYSTCSARGKNAGGFVGTATGAIANSYCTGLVGVTVDGDGKPVTGASAGAFAAECTGTTTSCSFFEIVNEFEDKTLGFDYLTALPKVGTGDGSKGGVTALDADANAYNDFTKTWSDAEPYLKATLMSYYGEGTGDDRVPKYNLKSVEQLAGGAGSLKSGATDTTKYFVATHYGDWPAPEIFVVNTKKTGS